MKLKNLFPQLSIFFSLLLLGTALAGCGTDDPAGDSTVPPANGNKPPTTPNKPTTTPKVATPTFTVSLNQKRDTFTYKHYVFRQPELHGKSTSLTVTQHVNVVIPDGTNLATAPVYVVLEGEQDASLERLMRETALPRFFGSKFVFIGVEHRGYGQSVSDATDQSVPKYVTADNAVDDAHAVITALKAEFKGPWIVAGAGYAGSLAVQLGAEFPTDAKVVVASSAALRYPAQDEAFEAFVRQTFGTSYGKLATFMTTLKPATVFDTTWQNREALEETLAGIASYSSSRKFLPLIEPLVASVKDPKSMATLVDGIKAIEKASTDSAPYSYGTARALRKVTRADVTSKDLNSRVYFYQQCSQLGGFHVSPTKNGVFTRTLADSQAECSVMFGAGNVAKLKAGDVLWSPEDFLDAYGAAGAPKLVYIRGGKDPQQSLGLAAPNWQVRTKNDVALVYDTAFGSFVNVPNGFHQPDLDDGQVSFLVWGEIMNVVEPKKP